jgi:hypothetical protein
MSLTHLSRILQARKGIACLPFLSLLRPSDSPSEYLQCQSRAIIHLTTPIPVNSSLWNTVNESGTASVMQIRTINSKNKKQTLTNRRRNLGVLTYSQRFPPFTKVPEEHNVMLSPTRTWCLSYGDQSKSRRDLGVPFDRASRKARVL